ncbi:hypothetical protein PsYK624_060910 [Phanerochaete sordida]|uniref:BTB domain-containing protein n=1 Tax=Phanerochaete sordida TaxID=48140 RepID=A0A9P3G661_9APHY|nr:hypothetical protein PsYK624_060910 [Phanerochaete sordida]
MDHDEEQNVSVSAVFYPTATLLPFPPDMVLVSFDRVFFYVHSVMLLQQSGNKFDNQLPVPIALGESVGVLAVRESSHVLNIVLHTIYGLACVQFHPSDDAISSALVGLHKYGIRFDAHLVPGTPLFALLAERTSAAPLFYYTLAGQYDLYALGALASGYLLATDAKEIPMENAERMGPVYLNRLLSLQMRRTQDLKEILRPPPRRHPATEGCDEESQASLEKAWMLTSAYLIWEGRPELTPTSVEVTFERTARSIQCEDCKTVFKERLTQALTDWAQSKRTI